MRRYIAYLKYVLRHKWFVFIEGRKIGVPLFILIFHDWDKFLPDEWSPYARTFYKPDGTKQYSPSEAFTTAWAKHQWRNKHHWQNWIRLPSVKSLQDAQCMMMDSGDWYQWRLWEGETHEWVKGTFELRCDALPMPDTYRREMLADWRGAGRALGFPDTRAWYLNNRDKMILHPETRAWIEDQLLS